jgi:hypothetical protein
MEDDKIIDVPGIGPVAFPASMSNDEIAAALERQFAPPTMTDKLKDSFGGGIVRGLRDIPDAGAQLLTRGLEAISPAGSSMESFFRGQRENVEQINRDAEADYQQNWRQGKMAGQFDGGRMVGNIAGTLPAMTIAPISAGMTAPALLTRGGIQGATASMMSQPVYNTEGGDYFGQKGSQGVTGAIFGAGGAYGGDKVAGMIQGGARSRAAAAGAGGGRASVNISANPTAKVSGGGSVFGQVGDDPTSALTRGQRALLKRGEELGFRNTPGQSSGSRALQQMEARMESSPFASGPFNTIRVNNQQALNRAVAGGIGETADTVDSAILSQADERLGAIFDTVADKVPKAIVGDDVVAKLAGIEQEFAGVLSKPLLDNGLVKRAFDLAAAGQATGKELRSLSSKLGRAAKSAMRNEPEQGLAFFQVKDMIDEIVAQNLDDATRETFNAARGQYRNLMTLFSRTNVVNPATGNVSGPNLASALMQRDKNGYLLGRNTSPMYDAARWAQAFKPIVGDSGTATRSMQVGAMDALLALPTNLAARAYVSRPAQGIANMGQRGLMPNAFGDAVSGAVRQGGAVGGSAYGFGLLND